MNIDLTTCHGIPFRQLLGIRLTRHARRALPLAALCLGACSSVSEQSQAVLQFATPYRAEVVQGNVVTKEQVDRLHVGMTRQQVRDILGTVLLTDLLHANRWDYVFTIHRQGVASRQRRLTLFFHNDELERFAGDEMPSEQALAAEIDPSKSNGKAPPLEASNEQLARFARSRQVTAP